MLIIGLIIGNWMFSFKVTEKALSHQQVFTPSGLNISSVESIEFNPESRHVSMKLSTMNQMTIEGNLDKPEIQHLLARTLRTEKRPNIRLKTVSTLTKTKSFDQQVIEALIDVLENDKNPGVRLKAIKLITKIPINSSLKNLIIKVLIKVLLKEQNSAIRIEAINGLSKMKNKSIAPVIYNAAKNDSSDYIRNKAVKILQRTKNPEI